MQLYVDARAFFAYRTVILTKPNQNKTNEQLTQFVELLVISKQLHI